MARFKRNCLGAGISAVALTISMPACAQADAPRRFTLPAQDLGAALRSVALSSGRTVVAPAELVRGKRTPPLDGTYTPEEAVARLIEGTGLQVMRAGNALVIRRQSADSERGARGRAKGPGEETVLVTGTRIRGRTPAGAAVTTIDRKAIDESGYATTQQILQTLPQNFGGGPNETTGITGRNNADFNFTSGSGINLRGLGASSTLVLLNGERPPMAGLAGVFTDLSLIPASAIERIEVLTDGASALYGSDAVAGVVNIVPRLRFDGFETGFRAGSGDGFDELQASALAGTGWSRGHVVLGYEYYRRSALAAADRSYFSEDLRRYGLGDYRSGPGLPGTIIAGRYAFAIPAGQDGTALTPGDLSPGAGEPGDIWAGADALPAQRRHALFGAATLEVTDTLEFYAQGLFGTRRYETRGRAYFNASAVTVPASNPFYVDPLGSGQPVQVRYNFLDELGAETSEGSAEALGGTAGIRWSVGTWQVDLHATYGRQTERARTYNIMNTARLAAALADTSPSTALNLFGDGTANNPATIASLRGSLISGGRYAMWSAQMRADGPLFALPAGDVRLAIGAEHRRERYVEADSIWDRTTLQPVTMPGSLDAVRRITAGYAELSLPLSARNGTGLGIGRLDLSAALRGEHYSDFGGTLNPRFGMSWAPVDGLVVRGSWGTSFRAPNFNDLRQDPASKAYFAYPLPDPAAPTGVTNALIIRGNDPGLGPERATSWTVGIDIRPGAASGPSARISYFDIDYRDRISSPASALLTYFTNRAVYAPIIDDTPDPAEVAAYFASPYFVRFSTVPASAVTAIVDARTQNLSAQRQRGLDLDLHYRAPLGRGSLELGASGTYLLTFSQRLTGTAPSIELVDTVGNPPDLRLRGRALYGAAGFGAALFANYTDGYRNASAGQQQRVGSWTTIDLQLSYRFEGGPLSGMRLALSASNLLDADPPRTVYRLPAATLGFDLENASPIGRVFAIQVSRQW